jgi:hypothetical protein
MNQSLAHEDAAVIGGIFVMLGTHSPTCSIKRVPVIANHSDIAGNRTQTNKHLESEQWKWSRRPAMQFSCKFSRMENLEFGDSPCKRTL